MKDSNPYPDTVSDSLWKKASTKEREWIRQHEEQHRRMNMTSKTDLDKLVVQLKHYLKDMPEAGDEDRFYSDSEIKRLELDKAMIAQTISVLEHFIFT